MRNVKLFPKNLWMIIILLNSQRSRASWRWIDDEYCKGLPADPKTCEESKGAWICQSIVDGPSVQRGWACMFREVGVLVNASRFLQDSERSDSDTDRGYRSSPAAKLLEWKVQFQKK